MKAAPHEDERLKRMSAICLELPKVTRKVAGEHAAFSVGKKTFTYFLNNHHGDGIVGLTCKVLPGDNEALIAANPRKFYMPSYVGPRGWVGLRLDVGKVDWKEVEELVRHSYRLIAPKKLAESIESGGE